MPKKIFITGIGTDVGKTVIAAIITEALKADYWKPIQAGDLTWSDTDRVKALVSNSISYFHENSYALHTPMSPHAAAAIDGITIGLDKIVTPVTTNNLVIEGAGGLLVPLNNKNTVLDLIKNDWKVIVVSRHYLGSINHTLMTLEFLRQRGITPYLIFNGEAHQTTESVIQEMTKVPVIGRINEETEITPEVVRKYANLLRENLFKIEE